MSEPNWLANARKYLGVAEGPGPKNNPAVIRFYAEAGFPAVHQDAVPWCAAFANADLHEVGIKGTGSLAALSFLNWGQHLAAPVVGCIAVMHRIGGGHVGFVAGVGATTVDLLAGNQGDKVCIDAFPRSQFVWRWPAGISLPAGAVIAHSAVDPHHVAHHPVHHR